MAENTEGEAFYRDHAEDMLRERGIPREAVEWVLVHYHTRRPAPSRPPAGPTDILVGAFEGRELKVYVVRDSNPPIVKTSVWAGD